MAILWIETPSRRLRLESREGETLLAALRRAGVAVTAPCGGNGTCGKCGVRWRTEKGETRVSACRTVPAEDGTVVLREQEGGAILQEGGGETAVTPGRRGLGAALDLGTTTVVLALMDLASGESLGTVGEWNAQGPYGADVITRCQYCMENETGTATLQRVIRDQVRGLLARLGREEKDLAELFVAGNTVMEHLYAGLSPAGIARAPFTPQTLFTGDGEAGPGLRYAPCVAGYVGGDITAGLLAAGLHRRRERALFLDIG
ncbi:MAG: 2Fe-2S iron-sulfur cluster binding domain-containing protein, partial [Oscillospiraceae bacterium]|nr:2Fe-2S iron-sulfur cluster binding domain-containing protein [Oscillospiraceae bacterium]